MTELTKTRDELNIYRDMNNGWSDDIEKVLDSIRYNATIMSTYHKKI